MFRHFIIPAAKDYYRTKGLNFGFHTLLRVLDDPASMVDPCGLRTDSEVIIGHLMQVVHANPEYDLQLLCSIENGLEQLEKELQQMIDGTHPRTESVRAIIEDAGYHLCLLALVKAFRSEKKTMPMLRENVASNPEFLEIEKIFGSLPTTMAYFCRLPTSLLPAMRHLLAGKLAA